MLQVNGLNAGYGDTQVLRNISLTVGDDEVVVVLGPNGHGKTTLLRTISGLLPVWSGSITFDGAELSGLGPHRIVQRGIAHIPQGDLLFPDMTVLDNLLMGAYMPLAWKERRQRLESVFNLFPVLRERGRQLARTLSGGERRMLAIGRGLMTPARLFLIDEPSLGLAPLLVDEVYQQIRHIAQTGISILLVDENATHAPGLAHRLYLLENGHFVREGKADVLMVDPALQAAYLGV